MSTRRGRKRRSNTGILLAISIAVFVGVIIGVSQFGILDGPVISSIEDVFTLQSLGDVQTTKCFVKFELDAFSINNIRIQLPASSAELDPNTGEITGTIFEGDLLAFTDLGAGTGAVIDRYELQPEIRCDKPNQSSGPIGWAIKYPSNLQLDVFVKNREGDNLFVNRYITDSFSSQELHDDFPLQMAKLVIPASDIDNIVPKLPYNYDSSVTFTLTGGINMIDTSRPNLTFTHFVGLNNFVSTQHTIKVLAEQEDEFPEDPLGTPNETITVLSVTRLSDGADLLTFQDSIDPSPVSTFDRSIRVFAQLEDFRDTVLNANEQTPRVGIFCLPESEGGVCSGVFQVGQLANMVQTGNPDVFEGTVVVQRNTNPGTYGVSVFSDDRDQVGSKAFLIEIPQTEIQCGANEELVNGQCVSETPVSCTDPNEARNPSTNMCEPIPPTSEDETCPPPLTGTPPTCIDPNAPTETSDDTGATTDPETGITTADAYFQYTINYAGDQQTGTANQEGVLTLEPQAIIGSIGERKLNLVEIRVTPLFDTTELGEQVQIVSGTTQNTARADLFVNGQLELVNFNIDYPQRTFGQVASNGLATFGLIGIQPAEIIDDASKRLDSQSRPDPLELVTGDALRVQLEFSNEFEIIVDGQRLEGAISPMTVDFPFAFVSGTVTSGVNEGCDENEVFSATLNTCIEPNPTVCKQGETYIAGHCVMRNDPGANGQCASNETKVGDSCIPRQNPSPSGTCNSPLVPDGQGTCVLPTQNEPECDTGGSLFDPNCLVTIFNQDGNPSGNDSNAGTCEAGDIACQERLQAAGTPLVSGGTLTFAIVGVVALIIGVIVVAVIQQSRNQNGS